MKKISNKIIDKLLKIFSAESISDREAIVLSLQLLLIVKLFRGKKPPFDLDVERLTEHSFLKKTWESLSKEQGLIKLGYAGRPIPNGISNYGLLQGINYCLELSKSGAFDCFDPTDCISHISYRKTGEASMPPELADLIVGLADIKPGMKVYTPWDNSGQFSLRAHRLGVEVYSEVLPTSPISVLINLIAESKVDIVQTDPIISPYAVENSELKKFDITISFLPIGIKYDTYVAKNDIYSRFPEKSKSIIILGIHHIIAQTIGRAVIIVPNKFLFGSGIDKTLTKKKLLIKNYLESVIELPYGLMESPYSDASIIILNLSSSPKTTRYINANIDEHRDKLSKTRVRLKEYTEIISKVFDSEKNSNADISINFNNIPLNLLPSRRILEKSENEIENKYEYVHTFRLNQIVDIIRPPIFSSKKNAKIDSCFEPIRVISDSDLADYGYILEPQKKLEIEKKELNKNIKKLVRKHDIIIFIKGKLGKIGIISNTYDNFYPWTIGQSAIILRIKDSLPKPIDPRVLATYLRSDYAQFQINKIKIESASNSLINLKELSQIDIVIPNPNNIQSIIKYFEGQLSIENQINRLRKEQTENAQKYKDHEDRLFLEE